MTAIVDHQRDLAALGKDAGGDEGSRRPDGPDDRGEETGPVDQPDGMSDEPDAGGEA